MKKQIKDDIEGFDNVQKIYFELGRKQALEEVEKMIDEWFDKRQITTKQLGISYKVISQDDIKELKEKLK